MGYVVLSGEERLEEWARQAILEYLPGRTTRLTILEIQAIRSKILRRRNSKTREDDQRNYHERTR